MENFQFASEKSSNLLRALIDAKIKMEPIFKNSKNPFHNNKYAGLGQFVEACEAAFYDYGLVINHFMSGDHNTQLMVTRLTHIDSGEWIQTQAPLINTKKDCQGLGSAITYMRRYTLSSLVGLCPDEDDDGANACREEPKIKEKAKPLSKEVEEDAPVKFDPNEEKKAFVELCDKLRESGSSIKELAGFLDHLAKSTASGEKLPIIQSALRNFEKFQGSYSNFVKK